MKKLFSFLFAFIMLMSMMPIGVSAAEIETSEYDEMVALACEVFPEYAASIRGETLQTYTRSSFSDPSEVVFTETRSISDTHEVGIAQLASGDFIITDNQTSGYELTVPSSSSTDIVNIGFSGTATFKVATASKVFKLSDVKFVIYYHDDNDYFSDYGTVTTSSYVLYSSPTTSSTRIHYPLSFMNSGNMGYHPVDFTVYLSGDHVYVCIS